MNTIFISGNMCDVPKVDGTGDSQWARFSLANSKGKDKGANFFNCVAFGKTAEIVEKFGDKGANVIVTGKLNQSEYKNKDGVNVKSVDIMVNEITFTNPKKKEESKADDMGFMKVDDVADEGLPFN